MPAKGEGLAFYHPLRLELLGNPSKCCPAGILPKGNCFIVRGLEALPHRPAIAHRACDEPSKLGRSTSENKGGASYIGGVFEEFLLQSLRCTVKGYRILVVPLKELLNLLRVDECKGLPLKLYRSSLVQVEYFIVLEV